jgi:amino acid permease
MYRPQVVSCIASYKGRHFLHASVGLFCHLFCVVATMGIEETAPVYDAEKGHAPPRVSTSSDGGVVVAENGTLKRGLKGRHMQMIAIGGVIGAGLFVGSGSALSKGGPASVVSIR